LRTLSEIFRPSEHFLHKDAGSTQQIQLAEQQVMPRETEGSTDFPGTGDALWSQIASVRNGFCNYSP
jgi:hypothetical protein